MVNGNTTVAPLSFVCVVIGLLTSRIQVLSSIICRGSFCNYKMQHYLNFLPYHIGQMYTLSGSMLLLYFELI